MAEHRHDAAGARAVALEDLDGRRLAGAVGAEQPEDLAAGDLEVDAAHRLELAVGLAQVADEDRGRVGSHGVLSQRPCACACIDIGSNTTRLLVAEPDEAACARSPPAAFTRAARLRRRDPGREGGGGGRRRRRQVAGWRGESGAERRSRVVATAAIRGAANREELCARRSTRRAASTSACSRGRRRHGWLRRRDGTLRRARRGTVAVVDVGGGSTEIVCGTADGGVEWSASFRVGSGFARRRQTCTATRRPPTSSRTSAARCRRVRRPRASAAARRTPSAAARRRCAAWSARCSTRRRWPRGARACGGERKGAGGPAPASPRANPGASGGLAPPRCACQRAAVAVQIAGGGLREGVILAHRETAA